MNTAELVADIAERFNITKTLGKQIVDYMTEKISVEVKKGNVVRLTGFGTFYKITRKGRTGHNPQNGEKVKIPTKKIPKFRPGRHFKSAVN